MLLKINNIPTICKYINDQTHCKEVVQVCGADSLPDVCTAKMIYMNLTYGGRVDSPFLMVADLYRLFDGAREKVFHGSMTLGNRYVHALADAFIQNVGG